jgi:TonB family protein
LPKTTAGAPAIDERGALIGVVTQRGDKAAPAIFHASAGTSAVVAQIAPIPAPDISPEESLVEAAPPEMVAPATPDAARTATPAKPQPNAGTPQTAKIDMNKLQPEQSVSPDKTPKGFFIRMNPNWHIHEIDRPHSTQGGSSKPAPDARPGKLVYTPVPRNPGKRLTNSSESGSGSYRLTFDDQGKVTDVQVVRSAGWSSLDSTAIATLRSWRAEGGRTWSVVVPVTFK